MENIYGCGHFSNDKRACPPKLLKTVPTTDILMTKSTHFRTAILKSLREKLLRFYKKYIVWIV